MTIRITKSRGRLYVQLVEYYWDPVRRRGRTVVKEHLGPLERVRFARPDLLPQIGLALARKQHGRGDRRAESGRAPRWEPQADFLESVLSLLRQAGGTATRSELKRLAERARIASPVERWSNDVAVGFCLTVLHHRGLIGRRGKGKTRSPFVYFVLGESRKTPAEVAETELEAPRKGRSSE